MSSYSSVTEWVQAVLFLTRLLLYSGKCLWGWNFCNFRDSFLFTKLSVHKCLISSNHMCFSWVIEITTSWLFRSSFSVDSFLLLPETRAAPKSSNFAFNQPTSTKKNIEQIQMKLFWDMFANNCLAFHSAQPLQTGHGSYPALFYKAVLQTHFNPRSSCTHDNH